MGSEATLRLLQFVTASFRVITSHSNPASTYSREAASVASKAAVLSASSAGGTLEGLGIQPVRIRLAPQRVPVETFPVRCRHYRRS